MISEDNTCNVDFGTFVFSLKNMENIKDFDNF